MDKSHTNDKNPTSPTALIKGETKDETTTIEKHSSENTKQTENVHPNKNSSQLYLLALAQRNSIDGALLPENKKPPLEERVFNRKKLIELKQQQNIESIILRSVQYCTKTPIKEQADQDWFSQFVMLAQDISNNTMQDLWAKILSFEISCPNSFSLKTLKNFRSMSITEAKLLAKACRVAITDVSKKNIRIIAGGYQMPKLTNFFNKNRQQTIDLNTFNFSYADILTLAENHLLFEQKTESHVLNKGEPLSFMYNGKPLIIKPKKNNCILTFYKFTPTGTELAALITDKPDNTFINTLKTSLSENFTIST